MNERSATEAAARLDSGGWSGISSTPMRQVLCMACGCSPTRSERACLGTLVSTAYGPPARPSVLQKSVSMSVFYGCVWVALFAAGVGEQGRPDSKSEFVVTFHMPQPIM